MNVLRRLPLSRLLLLCSVVVVVGIGATAIALAVSTGPTPAPEPLANAVHDALSAPRVEGVSARIQLTNHLLEGASLASGGGEASQLADSPLLSGASGRLWVGAEGHARLELQSEKGDTQILYDGHTISLYDASTNTLYRYTPPAGSTSAAGASDGASQPGSQASSTPTSEHAGAPPSVSQVEEAIAHAGKHADISGATPTDVAGQAAYTVRVSPREHGGLIAGAELSWDAVHGVPLRAAVYSTTSSAPVIELAATEVSYGPVASSTLAFQPPANAKLEEVTLPSHHGAGGSSAPAAPGTGQASGSDAGEGSSNSGSSDEPHLSTHGEGLEAIALLERPAKAGEEESSLEGLQKVSVNGSPASELPTQLGTLLTFERAGVRYLLAGAVAPASIEAFARGL